MVSYLCFIIMLIVILLSNQRASAFLTLGRLMSDDSKSDSNANRPIKDILFGAVAHASKDNNRFSLYATKEGCCKSTPALKTCEKQKELATFHKTWEKRVDDIEALAEKGLKDIEILNTFDDTNKMIVNKMIEITANLDALVKILLDKGTSNDGTTIQNDKIFDKNRNLMTSKRNDLEDKFENILGDNKKVVNLFGPLLSEIGHHSLSAYIKWQRYHEMTRKLGFSMSKVFENIEGHQYYKALKSIQSSGRTLTRPKKPSPTSSAHKISLDQAIGNFKTRIKGALALLIIGFNSWSMADTDEKCLKTTQRINENQALYKAEFKQLDEDVEALSKVNEGIKKAFKNSTKSIDSNELLTAVRGIQHLVKTTSVQNKDTKRLYKDFAIFINGISYAVNIENKKRILELQNILLSSLSRVESTYSCFVKKVTAIRNIMESCKTGKVILYRAYEEEYKNTASCLTDSVLSRPKFLNFDTIESAIKKDAQRNNYSSNCKLNDPNLRKLTCADYCRARHSKYMALKYDITERELTNLCKDHACKLTPTTVRLVCAHKKLRTPLTTVIGLFAKIERPLIGPAYKKCIV